MMLLLSMAHAMCISQLPRTHVWQITLSSHTPIAVSATWGSAERLAHRVRVRGPDGMLVPVRAEALGLNLQLRPQEAWELGVHTVEVRAGFAPNGERVTHGSPAHTAWFAMSTLEVVSEQGSVLAPVDVAWTRQSQGRRRASLKGEASRPEAVRWMDMEVDGVGAIARKRIGYRDKLTVWSGAAVRCNDTHQLLPVPVEHDLRVRLVSHGDAGARAEGAWTVLGPSGAAPTGQMADVGELVSWHAVPSSSDTAPPVLDLGACGSLALVSEVKKSLPDDAGLLVDEAGQIYQTGPHRGETLLDGRSIPGLTGKISHIAGRGGDLLIAFDTPMRLAVLKGREVIAVARLPGAAAVYSIVRQADGSIAVQYRDRWRTRFAQTLTADLEPKGESTRVLKPIVVDRDAFKVWSVNGFPIDGENLAKHSVGPDHVVFAHQLALERYLSVWSASGELVRKISLPMDARIGEIAVDELGVVYTYSLDRASRVGGMNFDGSPRDVNDVPVPEKATSVRRLPWAEGSVVFDGDGVGIEAPDGKQTMRLGMRRGSVVGVDGDEVVVAYLDRVSSELTERRYACTGESHGLPSFWLPAPEPPRSE